jgi:hypothetical protein
MKFPVNIVCKDGAEKAKLMLRLEQRGVLWLSGNKPTDLNYDRLEISICPNKQLGNGHCSSYGEPVPASQLLVDSASYMVYSPQGSTKPKKRHSTYTEAAEVARTMAAKYPGQEFMVLKVLPGSVKVENNPVTTDTLESDDD